MATFRLEDLEGTVEVLVWPNVYEKCRHLLESDAPLLVRGRCENDSRGESRVVCSDILPFESLWEEEIKKAKILVPVNAIDDQMLGRLQTLLAAYPGKCALSFELFRQGEFSVHIIPANEISVNPVPDFVREIENLFGQKSVSLYT